MILRATASQYFWVHSTLTHIYKYMRTIVYSIEYQYGSIYVT